MSHSDRTDQPSQREMQKKKSARHSLDLVEHFVRPRESEGVLEFSDLFDRLNFEKELRQQIRPVLVRELLVNPSRGDEYVKRRIEALVDQSIKQLNH